MRYQIANYTTRDIIEFEADAESAYILVDHYANLRNGDSITILTDGILAFTGNIDSNHPSPWATFWLRGESED